MPQKYRLLEDSTVEPDVKAGSIVYDCVKPDYGLANDDSREMGFECVSVTLEEDGDYPGFTVPLAHLEVIND